MVLVFTRKNKILNLFSSTFAKDFCLHFSGDQEKIERRLPVVLRCWFLINFFFHINRFHIYNQVCFLRKIRDGHIWHGAGELLLFTDDAHVYIECRTLSSKKRVFLNCCITHSPPPGGHKCGCISVAAVWLHRRHVDVFQQEAHRCINGFCIPLGGGSCCCAGRLAAQRVFTVLFCSDKLQCKKVQNKKVQN